ncbi:MAG: DUF4097 domain-containing protein [Clostridiales bacterium]|nr:DUF4097 domain-containing protein [Clostridiales bacterium]
MEFSSVKDIAIYGTECLVDISRGSGDKCELITAKEKYFDVQCDNNGQLTVTQKKGNFFYRIINRRFEFKLVLPRSFKGRLRFRNKNGGLYLTGGEFEGVELSTFNGKFDIRDISCAEFGLKMKNGTIDIHRLTAAQTVSLRCKNGNVKAETVSASALTISSDNAGLSAVDVRTERLDCSTHNGTIDVNGIAAPEVKLDTSNGKIYAAIVGNRDEYRVSLETSHGAITVDGTPSKNFTDPSGPKRRVTARTSNGDIDLRFL